MKREKIRQKLLDLGRGKDVLMLGPLGNYKSYRKDGMMKWWDFAYLKTIARSLVGIDINEELISVARDDGYPVIYGDAENFVGSYDLIYAPDLIEHLGNPLRCLKCCAAALRSSWAMLRQSTRSTHAGSMQRISRNWPAAPVFRSQCLRIHR
jgi:hypothetical protein